MKKMPLFDLNFVDGKRAMYFDDKHNGKRMRTAIISDTRGSKIDGTVISKDQLKYVFNMVGIKNISSLVDPNDRQNVAAVLRLFEALGKSVKICEKSDEQVLRELSQPLKILHSVFDGILCIFCDPKIDLDTQLIKLSKLSHILLHQYRAYGTAFIPGQLYHDLQRMVQGCYYACILQQKRGGGKLYLYQLGTDQLERLFSTVRTITHARNCDSLELCQRLSHAESLEVIISKHPTWKRMHGKRLCGNRDATSQREWTGELDVNKCDVLKLWNLGQLEAVVVLNISINYFTDLARDSGITMARPNKRLVGVNVDNERNEINTIEYETEIETEETEESIASLEIEEMLQDGGGYDSEAVAQNSVFVELDGSSVYKATVVKEVLNGEADLSSTDRLRRVRGYSKHPGSADVEVDGEIDMDDVIMIGDVLTVKVKHNGTPVTLAFVKITSMKCKDGGKYATIIPSISIGNYNFDGRIYEGKVTNDCLVLKHVSTEDCTNIDGNFSVLVQLNDMCIQKETAIEQMNQVPVSNKVVSSKLLPYDSSLTDVLPEESESGKWKCKLCDKKVKEKNMRKHVAGSHIIKEKLENVCGFCGLSGCYIGIEVGSGRGKTATRVVSSHCEYRKKFSLKSAEKCTKSSPCTNRPVTCPLCNTVHWSYNMVFHMKERHSDYPSDVWKLIDEELDAVAN